MKVEDVNELDGNFANSLCQRACVPKLALLGPAVCSQEISRLTFVRTYVLEYGHTLHDGIIPFNSAVTVQQLYDIILVPTTLCGRAFFY